MNPLRLQSARRSAEFTAISITFEQCCEDVDIVDHSDKLILVPVDRYRTLDYCEKHFADPAYGEWYGYLRRDGQPTEPPCKGSTFKGPFHVPRSLILVDKLMDEVEARQGWK